MKAVVGLKGAFVSLGPWKEWVDPRVAGKTVAWQAFHPAALPCPPLDNLSEVEMLVQQVKEKTSSIQALAHGTVGQSLPMNIQHWRGTLCGLPRKASSAHLSFASAVLEEALSLHHQHHMATAFV